MKGVVAIILALFVFQFTFAQAEKLVKGKVLEKDLGLNGADVINFTTQKSTVTDSDGVFYILAKANDIILVYRKNYIEKKVVLEAKDISSAVLVVELTVKPIKLDEVVIDKGTSMGIHITQADIDAMKLIKDNERGKVLGINDGSIPYGIDFARLGKDAYKLIRKMFKSGTKSSKGIPEIEFKKYVGATVSKDYFTRYLKLQPDEIPLFLEFCDADSNSKTIMGNPNVLAVMDFMGAKNTEFQKVLSLVK